MKWLSWVWRVLVVLALTVLPVTPVLAGTVGDVNLFVTPLFTNGITSFTITYVSDTQLRLDWTVGANVTNVMVRAKYGKYPNGITSNATAPSDGYLVYYGSALSANDTSMDFDANPGPIYYRAWAQLSDGSWVIDPMQGNKEALIVTYIAFFLLAIGLTLISLRWINILWSLIASIAWLFLWKYDLTNPPSNVAVGSTAQEWLTYLFVGAAIVTMLIYFWNTRNRRSMQQRGYYTTENGNYIRNETPPEPGEPAWDADAQAYRARVRRAVRRT